VTGKDTLKKNVANYTPRNTLSSSKKRERRRLLVVDTKQRVDNNSNVDGRINWTSM
jgi:hypothetical protein